MTGFLICILCESGVPVFARKSDPSLPPVSFPLAASLNGLKVFGEAHGLQLISTITGTSRVIWKDYRGKITLVAGTQDDVLTDLHLTHFLDNIYNVLVMFVGENFLLNTSSADKLKKEIKECFPLIDLLLSGLGPLEKKLRFGDLTGCPDTLFHSGDHDAFQGMLDQFLERTGVSYGCLSCAETVVAGSKNWWSLSSEEIVLLTILSHTMKEGFSEKIIFLPNCNPLNPFRLIVIRCTEMINLSLIIGSEPDTEIIRKESKRLRRKFSSVLEAIEDQMLSGMTAKKYFDFNPSISGFLIINLINKRAGFAILPDKSSDSTRATNRLECLRIFYKNTVDSIFQWKMLGDIDGESSRNNPSVKPLETYWSSEYHKCHGIQGAFQQLYVLYEQSVPNVVMRSTTMKLFCEIVKDHSLRSTS